MQLLFLFDQEISVEKSLIQTLASELSSDMRIEKSLTQTLMHVSLLRHFLDKKFTRSLDANWSPDTALRNSERSRNWEDGLGHGDVAKNARYANKLDRIRSNKRRYFKDIEDKVAVEERKEDKRIEYRRLND